MSEHRGKKPKRVRSDRGQFVVCPFCKYKGVHLGNPCRWCAQCFTKYEVGPKWATFDPNMSARSTAEAWAIAIAKSGGARIGAAS
jgi:hypothetical protein